MILYASGIKGTTEFNILISYNPTILRIINSTVTSFTHSFSSERKYLGYGYINLVLRSNQSMPIREQY